MAHGNEIVLANVRDDRDIGQKVEVDQKQGKFIKWREVVARNQHNVRNKDEDIFFQSADV
jgi:hypothetical protein